MTGHEHIETQGVPIKAWIRGVLADDKAMQQLRNVARLPFIYRWVAANRHRLPGGTPACSMPASERPS